MNVLGIDIGSRNLGLSVVSFDIVCLVEKTVVLTEPDIGRRLITIEKEIETLIKTHEISIISFEMPVIRGKNAFGLYYVCGIVHLLASKYNLPIYSYAAKEVKKEVTGSGLSDKDEVEKGVLKLLTNVIEFSSDHSSDAAAIALTYIQKIVNSVPR